MPIKAQKSPLEFLDRFPLQSMLTTLGKYLLGMEISHSTGHPMPVLKLLFPTEWLIPEDSRFIVEAEYFSNEETLYFLGPENTYAYLDDMVTYAEGIVKYNDAVEAKKLELAELLRQKELLLEESIREHRVKMESEGVKFREITVKKPEPQAIVSKPLRIELPEQVDGPWVEEYTNSNPTVSRPQATAEDMMLTPLVPRRNIPAGIDPAIFSEEEPEDERDYNPQPQPMPVRRPSANGGLVMVAPLPQFNRNEVLVQRHDPDGYNY